MSGGLRTGQVAAAAGVNVQTLRYYERRGLLREPPRTSGGHRQYAPETITVLRVIRAAQRLRSTLEEIADLLGTGHHRRRSTFAGAGCAPAKLTEVEAELAELAELAVVRDTLQTALDVGCDDLASCAASSCCPLPLAAGLTAGPME